MKCPNQKCGAEWAPRTNNPVKCPRCWTHLKGSDAKTKGGSGKGVSKDSGVGENLQGVESVFPEKSPRRAVLKPKSKGSVPKCPRCDSNYYVVQWGSGLRCSECKLNF